jgi:putative membrane protein
LNVEHFELAMNRSTEGVVPKAMRICARALAAQCLNFTTAGIEHVPVAGEAILITRHYHHFHDGLILMAALRRPVHILVTLDWAQNPAVLSGMQLLTRLARWPVILRTDALSHTSRKKIFSSTDILQYQLRGLREAADLLSAGGLVVVFPEGYATIDPHYTPKTRDSELLPFKAGFIAIANAAERRSGRSVPLIPVGLRYRKNKKWSAELAFGPPLRLNDFASRQALLRKLEGEVSRLSGLEIQANTNPPQTETTPSFLPEGPPHRGP